MPRRDRRGNSGGAEWLALRAQQERFAAVGRGGARHRERAAADLSQSGRWPGRACIRWRFVCAECRSLGGSAIASLRREDHDVALEQDQGRLALQRPDRAGGHWRPGRLHGLRAGTARLRRESQISRRAAGHFRRHRFRAMRGDRGRCAGRRARPRRHAAVPFHRAGVARRRGKARESARHSLRGAADRASGQRL